ncbi:ABC transporter substrate-binding protein [Ramlibacter rhizophilus]|uniref:ABC transporter substrate-binding protein n=2 Tax=Ramlibacter rhizophilus TaxID=1781167 RepID=A0A4Z0BFH3_9BURK|nr:ABC transporter substrate-binding protein [Ramlibacter rhizophilus]
MRMKKTLIGLMVAGASGALWAEIVVGVSASTTGPGASLGLHVANAVAILPKTIAGEPVRYVMLDDGSDPTLGAKNVRRLVSEDKVDVIIGSSTVPVALSQGAVANESRVAFLALCPIPIDPAKQSYLYAVPQPIPLMLDAVVEHMQANKVKKVGYIGFADSWGDLNLRSLKGLGEKNGIEVTTDERYARPDTSVTAQMLKVLSTSPDAVFVGASGTPAALPQIAAADRGYRKPMYHTHGVVNNDFIRVGGKRAEGAIAPTGPVVVAEQLPADNPLKAPGLEFLKKYEGAYGAGSRNAFAAYAWDAGAIIQAAVPVALKKAKPGTPEFRQAMRDAIESNNNVLGTHAVYNMSPTDHYGVDKRARVLVRVQDGEWKLLR